MDLELSPVADGGRRTRWLGLLLATVFACTGCSGVSSSTSPSSSDAARRSSGADASRSASSRPADSEQSVSQICLREQPIPAGVDDTTRVVAGVVVLPSKAPTIDEIDANDQRRGPWSGDHVWAKVGLLTRADTPVRLELTAVGGAKVAGTWGGGRPSDTIELPACPSNTGWLAWPGGFFVSDRSCVDYRITSESGAGRGQISIGDVCT